MTDPVGRVRGARPGTAEPSPDGARAVAVILIDECTGRGLLSRVLVRATRAGACTASTPHTCDRVMQAAANRAVSEALAAVRELGRGAGGTEGCRVEWWVEGPEARYTGASLGLAVALGTVAGLLGAEVSPRVAVTGAVDRGQVVAVSGVVEKWRAVRDSGRFDRLVLPRDNWQELPEEARHQPADPASAAGRLVVAVVGTVTEAVKEVFGPAAEGQWAWADLG